jgi:septation ring formation regulator EzrA
MKNEERILSILESMQGQMSTMQGQMSTMQGQMSTMQGQISDLQTGQKEIGSELKEIRSELADVRQSVAVIEHDHGKKIGALYDHMSLSRNLVKEFDELKETVGKLKFGSDVIRLVNILEKKEHA